MNQGMPEITHCGEYLPCLFCKGTYCLGEVNGRPVVAHTLPYCHPYEYLGADDFLLIHANPQNPVYLGNA